MTRPLLLPLPRDSIQFIWCSTVPRKMRAYDGRAINTRRETRLFAMKCLIRYQLAFLSRLASNNIYLVILEGLPPY